MMRYRVTGYTDRGERLFSLTVEALSSTDAKLTAFAQLRKRPAGIALVNRTIRVETEQVRGRS